MRWAEYVALGRRWFRWEDIIKTYLRNWGGSTWTEFGWLELRCKWRAVVHLVMNLRLPRNAGNSLRLAKLPSYLHFVMT